MICMGELTGNGLVVRRQTVSIDFGLSLRQIVLLGVGLVWVGGFHSTPGIFIKWCDEFLDLWLVYRI